MIRTDDIADADVAACVPALRGNDSATLDGHLINSWILDFYNMPGVSAVTIPFQTDPDVLIAHISPEETVIYTPDGGIRLPNGALIEVHELNSPIGYTGQIREFPITLLRQYNDTDGSSWHQVIKVINTTYKPIALKPHSIRPIPGNADRMKGIRFPLAHLMHQRVGHSINRRMEFRKNTRHAELWNDIDSIM